MKFSKCEEIYIFHTFYAISYHTFLLVIKLNFFFSIITDISDTGIAVAKKNLSQIVKLIAAVACKLDHTSQKSQI